MIDQLSDGRLEFGAGVGGTPDSFRMWNLPFEPRRSAAPEALDIIEKAWKEDRFTYHGEYYNFDDVIPLPHPYQKPHPPMWFVGRTRESLELSVARKYGVGMFALPDEDIVGLFDTWRKMWKDSGHKGPRPPSLLTRSVYVAETDEQAYEEAAPYLPNAYAWGEEKFHDLARLGADDPDSEPHPTRVKTREMIRGMRGGIDFWLEHNLAYVGSPETVIRRIEETRKTMGYNVFGGRFRFGPIPDHLVENSLRLFGEKVIPAFADVLVAPTPAA